MEKSREWKPYFTLLFFRPELSLPIKQFEQFTLNLNISIFSRTVALFFFVLIFAIRTDRSLLVFLLLFF